MIIVSQDKNIVVNFDNVANINIEKCYNESTREDNFTFDILVFIVSSGLVRIGKYKTEERVKEVLQEIVQVYVSGKKANEGNTLFGSFQWIPADTLYEMPKE